MSLFLRCLDILVLLVREAQTHQHMAHHAHVTIHACAATPPARVSD